MADSSKIELLREHISSLTEDISILDVNEKEIPVDKYMEMKRRKESSFNLLAIAKNELRSLLHQYEVTLIGDVAHHGILKTKVYKRTIFLERDYNIKSFKHFDISNEANNSLMEFIYTTYTGMFQYGKFRVKNIRQER